MGSVEAKLEPRSVDEDLATQTPEDEGDILSLLDGKRFHSS